MAVRGGAAVRPREHRTGGLGIRNTCFTAGVGSQHWTLGRGASTRVPCTTRHPHVHLPYVGTWCADATTHTSIHIKCCKTAFDVIRGLLRHNRYHSAGIQYGRCLREVYPAQARGFCWKCLRRSWLVRDVRPRETHGAKRLFRVIKCYCNSIRVECYRTLANRVLIANGNTLPPGIYKQLTTRSSNSLLMAL